jgi:mannose-6-phosphate isomerase-like protein (cupin superfamily)
MSVALVRNPGEGTLYPYYDYAPEQVVSHTETGGVVSVVRLTMRQADAPPLHSHSREDESWVILSGRLRFWVGSASLDACDVHDAEAGAYVFGPRLVPHTFQPLTETAEVLVINNPGAVEEYFRAVGSAADGRHDDDHVDLLTRYGMTLLDGPPRGRSGDRL